MNKYQYQAKSKTLEELYGVQVKDFGRRRVEYGTSGQDVLVLQQFLIEEGYLNTSRDDGAHGYFGESSKRALQAWQSDVGIAPTGVFDDISRAAYLKYIEDTLRMIGMVEAYNVTAPQRAQHIPLVDGVPVIAGTLAIILFAWLKKKKPVPSSDIVSKSHGEKKIESTRVAQTSPSPGMRKAEGARKKLSKEELEKHIAPMRGRSREAKNIERKRKDGEKLGRYFGGRQVIEDIRKKIEWGAHTTRVIGSNISSRKMEHVGYDMKEKYTPKYDTILDGTELDMRSTDKSTRVLESEKGMHNDIPEHKMLDNTTVVLQNKPVKLHKPLKPSK